jgi:streptogramin lyase
MRRYDSLSSGLLSLACAVALTGCATSAIFPDPGAATVQSDLGSIRGSNYGGHAPIVGAHLFVLQAGTGGYGTASTSLLTASYPSTGPAAAYPTALDSTPGSVTQGDYYVTTDSSGSFNISGDYTCTAGLPVYLYAAGGTSALQPYTSINTASYTVTSGGTVAFTGVPNLLSVGQYVKFSGMTAAGLVTLGSGQYQVTAATLTSFTVTGTLALNGTGTTSGIVTPVLTSNPAIGNMAVLGNCPSTGVANFSSLTYVYMNEVSTVAAAYALSGYFSNSATSLYSTDALHLAVPLENGNSTTSPAWVGIQNAALNAAQLYDIQGNGPVGTSADGENHGANNTTASGGTVPAALVNSIANALAACVDSGNTAATPTVPCTTLFGYALPTPNGNGGVTGTAPKDTGTAAINLAHNPWNSNATNILNLQTNLVPYLPTTSSATDLAIAISYPIAHQSGQFGGVAIDASGNAWVTSFTDPAVTKLSPQGAVLVTNTLPAGSTPGSVALDSAGNAWVAIRDVADFPTPTTGVRIGRGVYKFTSTGATVAGSPFLNNGATGDRLSPADDIQMAIDGSDNVYLTNHPYNDVLELSSAGTYINAYGVDTYSKDGPYGVALDASSNIWMSSNISTNSIAQYQNGGAGTTPLRVITTPATFNPETVVIDQVGNVWASDAQDGATNHNDVILVTPAATTGTLVTGGGAENTVGMAVDGSGLVFAASVTGGASNTGSLAVFNNTPTALSGSNGINGQYTVSGGSAQVPMNGPYFIAIDASGDVWAQTNTTVVEYIGVATPVLTPLSAAVKAGTIAARP